MVFEGRLMSWRPSWWPARWPWKRKPKPPPPGPAEDLLALLNARRAERGLPFLRLDPRLQAAAEAHAAWMAVHGSLTHGGDGSLESRLAARDYNWGGAAENVAQAPSATAAVAMWLGSPAHRANLLGPYRDGGAAGAGGYWCAVFAFP
jgi:uncharacterized protein YkwD